jgi:hypothetical protein
MNRKQLELPVPFTNNTHVTIHAKSSVQYEKPGNHDKNYTLQELHASLHRCISSHLHALNWATQLEPISGNPDALLLIHFRSVKTGKYSRRNSLWMETV